MKKILIAVVLALNTLCLSMAHAVPSCADALGVTFPPAQKTKLCAYFLNTASLTGSLTFAGAGPIIAPTSLGFAVGAATTPNYTMDNVKVSMPSTGVLAASTAISFAPGAANTPIYRLDNAGLTFVNSGTQPIFPSELIMTPATNLTPVAGARFASVVNRIATAAPTAIYAFAQPTASVGKTFSIYHQGASPLNIIPEDGTINAAAALTPFVCTTGKMCICRGFSTGQMVCSQS